LTSISICHGRTGGRSNRLDEPALPIQYALMEMITDKPPADWLEPLARSKAEIEAGKTVPLEPFLDRLRASIARMKARPQEPGTVPKR
jgi:hypothetical protein